MDLNAQRQRLAEFVDRWGTIELFSTGSRLINFSGVLYNVDGSSDDPEINGENWKGLLIANGINSNCYVSNETPEGNSHPKFSVGGHMTPNEDGQVEFGADSYLMPLCSWHNNKSRDGVAFEHTKTLMLKLSGFMQGEIAATFMARLPSERRHAIVYTGGDEPMCANLSEPEADAAKRGHFPDDVLSCHPRDFILFERVERDEQSKYVVTSSSLSD